MVAARRLGAARVRPTFGSTLTVTRSRPVSCTHIGDGVTARSFGAFDLLLRVRDDLRQGAIRYALGGRFVADDVTGVPGDDGPPYAAIGL